MEIKKYLNDLESRIDAEQEEQLLAKWMDFADLKCRENYFLPSRKKRPPLIEWEPVFINDALKDEELMIYQQLRLCSEMLENGTGELLCIRSNYGTPIIPTMFGAELFIMPYDLNCLPGSKSLPDGKEGVLRILDNPVIDFDRGIAKKVFSMAEKYKELVRDYPKIQKYVYYYNPDLQGPLPLCESLWGSDIYIDFYDDVETVERALDFFTDVYIRFTKKWHALCPPLDAEHSVEWGCLHRGGTVIRNDAAMNISGELYEQFVKPRDQRIIDEFGGAVHFCGKGDHYVEKLSQIRGLSSINMSQPDYNDMEVIYRNTIDKGLTIFGMISSEVERAVKAGRDLKGRVHCGASMAAWVEKDKK